MFSPKIKWNYILRGERRHSEAIMEGFTKTLQRHTTRNIEHRNLLISILVGNLPDVKKEIEDNVVGWMGLCFDIVQVATQFFEELKITEIAL